MPVFSFVHLRGGKGVPAQKLGFFKPVPVPVPVPVSAPRPVIPQLICRTRATAANARPALARTPGGGRVKDGRPQRNRGDIAMETRVVARGMK